MYGLTLILGFVIHSVKAGSNLPLLSGTLRTFQVHACDGNELQIECWPNTVVSIYLAQYGRQVPSHQLCPPESVTEGSLDMLNDTTDCIATHALRTMEESCREQRVCKIKTSPQTFGNDPCPGVRKYAEVAYKCRPTVFSNKVVCEGERLRLKCESSDSRIVIFSASFGATRQGVPECPQPDGEGKIEDCQVVHATEAVMGSCHGKKQCSLGADVSTFGKMGCPPTTRLFLKVVHTCVPKEILKDQDLGVSEETKDPEDGDYTGFIEEPRYAPPITPESSLESTKPPLKTPPTSRPQYGEGEWKGLATTLKTDMRSENSGENVERELPSRDDEFGFFIEIIHAIKDNKEKFILYLTLILSIAVIAALTVVATRFYLRRSRRLREAAEAEVQKQKSSLSPPGGEGGISPFGTPDPFEDPLAGVEVVMFTPRSSFKKALPIEEDDCSFPRAPVSTHNNFYYS